MSIDDQILLGQPLEQLLAELPPRISSPLFDWARRQPQAIAVRDHTNRCLSYGELAAAVCEAAAMLRELGVGPKDRVLLINENCVTLAVLVLALSELDAWSVVVNARMASAELARIETHCEPRLTLYLLDSAAAAMHWQSVPGTDQTPPVALQGSQVGVFTHRGSQPEQDAEGICSLIYTTGTTGDPKGVMLSHRNILFVAATTSVLRGMRSDDRIFAVLPLSHVFGLAAVFLATIYVGAELVLADRFEAATVLQTLKVRKITGMFGVPTMFARLLETVGAKGLTAADVPRLRFLYSGGAPLDPRIKADTEALFGIPLFNAYGMTESGPTICQVRFNERPDSCTVGRPLPGLEIQVLDPQGKPVEAGEVGELHVRGPNVMRGYFRNPAATAAVLHDGYLNTGDLVRFDATGNMHIAGRSKELIIHSGFNVYPPEVEAVISRHPDVVICAVVGRQEAGNELVIAYVQKAAESALDAAALQAFVKPHLAAYKRPAEIIFMELPTAASGKVLKHRLGRV